MNVYTVTVTKSNTETTIAVTSTLDIAVDIAKNHSGNYTNVELHTDASYPGHRGLGNLELTSRGQRPTMWFNIYNTPVH